MALQFGVITFNSFFQSAGETKCLAEPTSGRNYPKHAFLPALFILHDMSKAGEQD